MRRDTDLIKPKVSIITVTYNCVNTIENTLKNVINQDYFNKEIIVIDGLSTDGTLNVINKYSDSIDILVSEKDDGIFDAMNKGIDKATGYWIVFMNSGDSFFSLSTLSEMEPILRDKTCGVIYSPHVLQYNKKRRLIDDVPFFQQKGLYRRMGFSHQSCLVRRDLASKYKFLKTFKMSADFKMMWDIYREGAAAFTKYANPIAVMDDCEGETVSNYKRHLIEECIICGFSDSILRSLFIEWKYVEYKIKRIIKRLLF